LEERNVGLCWGVQRQEIRKRFCVKHQRMAGSNLGDDHKTFFAGDKALKADGAKNTSNQFESKNVTERELVLEKYLFYLMVRAICVCMLPFKYLIKTSLNYYLQICLQQLTFGMSTKHSLCLIASD
jgi:hypothetical protein